MSGWRVLPIDLTTERVALGPDAIKGKTPDGTIEMHEVQAAYISSRAFARQYTARPQL